MLPASKRAPLRELWWTSLPARVVLMTLIASALIAVAGGWFLLFRATNGVVDAKQQAALAEAQTALDRAQSLLDASNDVSESVDQRLIQVARDSSERAKVSGQYEVLLDPASGRYKPGNLIEGDPIPEHLREKMTSARSLYHTPTEVRYVDGRPPVPGLVVGALLETRSGTAPVPIYFVFPMGDEVQTLALLQQAVAAVGVFLLLGLAAIAYAVARTVASPVREAALTARSIASGDLDQRMRVRGHDEFAVLGDSMNYMAAELKKQIASYEDLAVVQQRFVSDVSHELRTPLTTVRMAAEVLYDDRDDMPPVRARSTEILHDELEKFEGLLADLLEISRFDAGAAVLSVDRYELADVVRDEIRGQTALAEAQGVELRLRAVGNTWVEMDARRVRRVLRNLLTNAIEHGERRPVEVAVAGNASAVAVSVRDHGIGFKPSESKQVFHRFWRADPSRARTVGGSGLGLAIALEDAQLHGGWLQAWGRPGVGAVFRLTLPRVPGTPLAESPLPLAPREEITA